MGLHKSIEKRNVCAKCGKIMDLKNYHIQLCRSCREEELEKEIKKLKRRMNNEKEN